MGWCNAVISQACSVVSTFSRLVYCRKLSLTEVQTSDITFPISPCACCHLHSAYSAAFSKHSATQAHLSQLFSTSATSSIPFAALRFDATCRCEGLHMITSHPFCEPDWTWGNHFVPTIDWLWQYIYTWLESFKYNKFKLAGRGCDFLGADGIRLEQALPQKKDLARAVISVNLALIQDWIPIQICIAS